MIFKDVFIAKSEALETDFSKLFSDILQNQTHAGDLLLVKVNGFYNPDVFNWDNIQNQDPYMIGLNYEGHSDLCHYKFIDTYRQKALSRYTFKEYLEKHEWNEDKINQIHKLEQEEGLSIQLEMLIYLKIWEADLFIKNLYQLTNLCLGIPYDWHFKIAESNRDTDATGKREEIIRKKIRDRLREKYPALYAAIQDAYKTQIRNAIAHSRYFLTGRYIHLTNFIDKDPHAQINVLSFDKWIDIFHTSLAIHNQLIGFSNRIDEHYSSQIKSAADTVEVRLIRRNVEETSELINLEYRKEFNDWHPKS